MNWTYARYFQTDDGLFSRMHSKDFDKVMYFFLLYCFKNRHLKIYLFAHTHIYTHTIQSHTPFKGLLYILNGYTNKMFPLKDTCM